MKRTRQQQKTDLMNQAEQLIDQLLDWGEQANRPDLTQMEDLVLQLRKELGQEMVEALLEQQDEQTPVPGPVCSKCGKEMHYKGQRTKQVESRAGALAVERGYYVCAACGETFFPPGPSAKAERPKME